VVRVVVIVVDDAVVPVQLLRRPVRSVAARREGSSFVCFTPVLLVLRLLPSGQSQPLSSPAASPRRLVPSVVFARPAVLTIIVVVVVVVVIGVFDVDAVPATATGQLLRRLALELVPEARYDAAAANIIVSFRPRPILVVVGRAGCCWCTSAAVAGAAACVVRGVGRRHRFFLAYRVVSGFVSYSLQ